MESKVPHTVRGLVSSGTKKAIEHKLFKRRGDRAQEGCEVKWEPSTALNELRCFPIFEARLVGFEFLFNVLLTQTF